MTDTEDEFKAATEGGLDDADLAGLTEVIEDEEVVVDDGIIDPLLPIDEEEEKEEDIDDDKADMEALMWQEYDER